MTREQKAIAALELALPFGVFSLLSETVGPALERARVVDVLDSYATSIPGLGQWRLRRNQDPDAKKRWVCALLNGAPYYGETPDEARAAAAKAVEAGEV